MSKETAEQSQRHTEQSSGSQSTPVAVDDKAANEEAAADELVRARNKEVRVHRQPEAEGEPPFSNFSGPL
jgi:hypothetical protein